MYLSCLPILTKFNAAVVVDLLVFSYIKGVTYVSWMLHSLFMTMHVRLHFITSSTFAILLHAA